MPETRLGVHMSDLKAHIFDVVKRAGVDGISNRDIRDIVWPGADISPHTCKAHVFQINDLIEDSGYKIIGSRGHCSTYTLTRIT